MIKTSFISHKYKVVAKFTKSSKTKEFENQEWADDGESAGSSTQSPSEAGASSQGPESAGASSQSPHEAGASSQNPQEAGASSQGPHEAGASSQSPEEAGASSQSPHEAGASSQNPEEAGASSQSPEGASSHAPDSGASSHAPESGGASSQEPEQAGASTESPQAGGGGATTSTYADKQEDQAKTVDKVDVDKLPVVKEGEETQAGKGFKFQCNAEFSAVFKIDVELADLAAGVDIKFKFNCKSISVQAQV